MSKQTGISIRSVAIVTGIVLVVAFIASAILGRIVFKADAPSANVYFGNLPSSVRTNQEFSVQVQADFSAKTVLTGAQFSLNYDQTRVRLEAVDNALGFQTVEAESGTGNYSWVMTSSKQTETVFDPASKIVFATLHFHALADGASKLTLDPTSTILAASSLDNPRGVFNSLAAVQDATISVSATAPIPSVDSEDKQLRVAAEQLAPDTVYGSQRIVSTDVMATPTSATVLIDLQYPARLSVQFGPTAELGSNSTATTVTDSAAIKLVGLESNRQYYYQVTAGSVDTTDQIKSQLRSFQTPVAGTGTVDHARLVVFPTKAADSAMAYALFYDENDKVVSAEPTLDANNAEVSTSHFSSVDNLYQANVSSVANGRRIANLTLTNDSKELADSSILFDSSIKDATQPTVTWPHLAADQKTINVVLMMLAALLLASVGFYKLSRVH